MKTNHTPGPWSYLVSPGKTWSDHGMRAVANVGKYLVWIPSDRVKELHNKSESNAKLIAAAPDLLEAAIRAYETLEQNDIKGQATLLLAIAIRKAIK